MNNLSSYCGLVDAKIRASDKDLPVLANQSGFLYFKNAKIAFKPSHLLTLNIILLYTTQNDTPQPKS